VGEGRLWERLRIYSGKYLFNKCKFYLEKFLSLFVGKLTKIENVGQRFYKIAASVPCVILYI
jgi:hypothetical protein